MWIKGFDSNWRPEELIPDLDWTASDVDPAILAEQLNVTVELAALRLELAKSERPP